MMLMSNHSEFGVSKVKTTACDLLLEQRVDRKLASKATDPTPVLNACTWPCPPRATAPPASPTPRPRCALPQAPTTRQHTPAPVESGTRDFCADERVASICQSPDPRDENFA